MSFFAILCGLLAAGSSSGGGGALPVVTAAAVITSAPAGAAPVYTNAASTSTPTPTIAYSLLKAGSVVATGAAAIAAYTSTVAGDSLVIRAVPSNSNGTGASVDSAAFVVTSAGDADVTAYAAAVTTAGGTLPTSHQSALNASIAALKSSGAWALIKELWLPLGSDGDMTTANVKLKNGATSPSLTTVAMVSTDYTVLKGYDGGASNATKYLKTDFAPAVNGSLTSGEWGFGVYLTRAPTVVSSVHMGMAANTLAYLQITQAHIGSGNVSYNVAADTFSRTAIVGPTKRLESVQITSGAAAAYKGGYPRTAVSMPTPGSLPTGAMSILSCNNSFFSDAAVSGYAIYSPMTAAQLRALQTFFDNVCAAIGRTVFDTTSLVVPGDSYTANPPTGPSTNANDWVQLVATAKGWTNTLIGNSGRGWGTDSSGYGGANTFASNLGVTAMGNVLFSTCPTHFILPLGINDANSAAASDANFTTQTHALLDYIAAVGYPMGYIAIATPYWASGVTSQTLLGDHANITRTNATNYGCRLIDFYAGLTSDPAVGGQAASLTVAQSYETAGIHKNDAGHVVLKTDVLNAISAGAWAGW